MKILIADDSATMRKMLAARLQADGYEVMEAADGEQALTIARTGQPDLLILDNMMPKLDGPGVVRALKDDPATRAVPIVMLTGRTGEDDREDCLRLGVDDYLPKPVSPRDLSARVRRTLERTGR
jgi:two-component system, OmpR family, alkaline phosphatase synthesis response regulator PhoP